MKGFGMKSAAFAFQTLSSQEKLRFSVLAVARIFLSFLDLAGLALVGLTVTVLTGGQISSASLTGQVLQWMLAKGFSNTYALIGSLAVVFFFVKGLSSLWLNNRTSRFLVEIESKRAQEIFGRSISNGLEPFDKWSTKTMLHAVTSSASTGFAQSLLVSSVVLGEASLLLTVSVFLAWQSTWLFACLVSFFGVFGLILNRYIGSRSSHYAESINRSYISLSTVFTDAVDNLRQAASMDLTRGFVAEFTKYRRTHAEANSRLLLIGYLPRYVTETLLMLGLGGLLLQRSLDGGSHIPASTLGIFVAGAFRMIASILPLQGSLANLRVIDIDSNDARTLLAMLPATEEESFSERKPHTAPIIRVSSLKYRHKSAEQGLFENLSFTIEPGQLAAVIGSSGAGKSTLADLLLGLRPSNASEISFDGLSVREYLRKYPGSVAYVPQQSKLIAGTLKQNLLLGYEGEDFDEALATKILTDLALANWFGGLAKGFQENLGDGAMGLSGGQVQRIGIARALYRKPVLLILDESTSALDSASEDAVHSVIQKRDPGVTTIFVSHRRRLLQDADLIIDVSK